jgi:hypothetical protein
MLKIRKTGSLLLLSLLGLPPVVGLGDDPVLVRLYSHGVDDDPVLPELEGGLPDPGVDGGRLTPLLLREHRLLGDEPARTTPHLHTSKRTS